MLHGDTITTLTSSRDESRQPELPVVMLPREPVSLQTKRDDAGDLIKGYKSQFSVRDEGLSFNHTSTHGSLSVDVKWSAIRIVMELFK